MLEFGKWCRKRWYNKPEQKSWTTNIRSQKTMKRKVSLLGSEVVSMLFAALFAQNVAIK